jgi:hypothetical protein
MSSSKCLKGKGCEHSISTAAVTINKMLLLGPIDTSTWAAGIHKKLRMYINTNRNLTLFGKSEVAELKVSFVDEELLLFLGDRQRQI